jgi:hypothetical protein
MSRARKCVYPATPRVPRQCHVSHRRGVVSVLAMLYLIIFATLALGFYTAVTTSAQLANNDERAMGAQIAAESGLQYLKFQLGQVRFPSNTPSDKIFQELFNDLQTQVLNAPNMGGRSIAMAGNTIYFPGGGDDYYIPLNDSGAGFRAILTDMGDGTYKGRTVRVIRARVIGRYRGTTILRAVEMDFVGYFQTINIFDFGVATRGPVNVSGSGGVFGPASLDGSILTTSMLATPVTIGATVAGDLYLTNPKGNVSLSNSASVGGTSGPDKYTHIRKGVDEPQFPVVDSSPFLPYATNLYKPGLSVYTNTLIPANTNPNFSGDITINGVMYVKYPNRLKFVSKVTINGLIIVENGAKPSSNNTIDFGGGMDAFGMDALPDTAEFPESMKKLKGSVLLAPGFAVTMRGGAGTIGGTMLAESFDLGGGAGGVVHGNLIGVGLGGFTLGGQASLQRTRSEELPAGLIVDFTFQPKINTYTEVRP